jgi:hypothetical protein
VTQPIPLLGQSVTAASRCQIPNLQAASASYAMHENRAGHSDYIKRRSKEENAGETEEPLLGSMRKLPGDGAVHDCPDQGRHL